MKRATRCAICGGAPYPGNPLIRGHIIARALGGQSVPHNYRAEHARCGSADGGRLGAYLIALRKTVAADKLPTTRRW